MPEIGLFGSGGGASLTDVPTSSKVSFSDGGRRKAGGGLLRNSGTWPKEWDGRLARQRVEQKKTGETGETSVPLC